MPLPVLLDAPDLPPLWHTSYGMTEARANALTGQGRYSLLNPNSETALTLFTLGRLDGWRQCGAFATSPRICDPWNPAFFRNLLAGMSNVHQDRFPIDTTLRRLLAGQLGVDVDLLGNAAILFEFEVRNRAFTGGFEFDTLSFLDIKQKWSQYDAVVMVPRLKRILFVEAKLGSDIGRRTARFPYVNQVMRNLEAAYFLCNAEESPYCREGWDFAYFILCPRKEYEYRLSYFANLIRDLNDHVAIYKTILERECANNLNRDRLNAHFERFAEKVSERVKVIYWDQLWERLFECGFSWANYLVGIRASPYLNAEASVAALTDRLRFAGVTIPAVL